MKAIKILENIKPKRQFHISRPITEEVIQEAYGAEDLEKARIASKEMLIQDMEPSLINEEEPREQKEQKFENVKAEKNDFNADNFSNDFSIETDGELGKKKIEMKGLSDWKDYDLKGVISKMVTFGTTMSGVKLYPYQIEFLQRIFESILLNDGQTITALFSRQSGKTEVVAIAIDTLMVLLPILAEIYPAQLSQYSKGIAIGLFAPTAEQGITTHSRADMRLTNEKAAQILSDPDLDAVKNYKGGILSITGPTVNIGGMIVPRYKSFCKFHSAAKQTKIESKTYNLLILEESQEIDDYKILKSILPMGASTLATTILIGTPVPYRCFFYEMCQKNKLKNNVIRNHFEYDYKTVQRYNPRYAAYINIEKERQGVESDTFRLAYGLEWLLEEGMALTLQQIQEYMADFEQDFEYDRVDENAVYGAGIDFAKGTDSTVIAIFKLLPIPKVQPGEEQRFLKKFINFIEIRGENWESQIHIILDLIQSYQLQVVTVDATGKGDPLFERLQLTVDDRGLECTVKGVVFSTKSKHDMAVHFYDEMRRRHISLPFSAAARGSKRMKEFVKQWTMCEKVHDGKWMKLRHPDIKGAKDDYVDATILALYGVKDSFLRRIRVDEEAIKRKSEAERRFEQAIKSFRRIGFKRR